MRNSDSGTGNDAGSGIVEPRTSSPPAPPNRDPDRSPQHQSTTSGDALYSENGAKMQPVPQRDRGDGRVYTKKVRTALSLRSGRVDSLTRSSSKFPNPPRNQESGQKNVVKALTSFGVSVGSGTCRKRGSRSMDRTNEYNMRYMCRRKSRVSI